MNNETTAPSGTGAIDTNAEYILPEVEKKQPPVFKSVAKAIIVDTVKDFFGSIIGFFLRYIRHFIRCLTFFVVPSLKKRPFSQLDYKENSQHAFEFIIIALAILIFMSKVGWIPPSEEHLLELYSDDLVQKGVEVILFFFFALSYLVLAGIGILLGRMFRSIFKLALGRDESDILNIYLNNAFFSIGAIVLLIVRSVASTQVYDETSISEVIGMIVLPSIFIPTVIWSVRMAYLHKLNWLKGFLYFIFATTLYSSIYGIGIWLVCAFGVGV